MSTDGEFPMDGNTAARLFLAARSSRPIQAAAGPYALRLRQGEGELGEVWAATDTRSGEEVSLKLLTGAGLCNSDDARRAFVSAMGRLKPVRHANLVPLSDCGEAEWHGRRVAYLASPAVETRPLPPHASAVFSTRRALRLVERLADGLEHAHGAGCLHAHVSSAAIVLAPGGEPALCDLGVLPALPAEDREALLSSCGPFLAPEIAAGGAGDARSDVFGLGALLRWLLATIPAPDGDLEALCRRAAEPEPSRRFPSAGALAEALRAHLEARDRLPAARLLAWSTGAPRWLPLTCARHRAGSAPDADFALDTHARAFDIIDSGLGHVAVPLEAELEVEGAPTRDPVELEHGAGFRAGEVRFEYRREA